LVSDWSSDVCSSDLALPQAELLDVREDGRRWRRFVLAYGDPDYPEDVGSGKMGPALRH